ncbi:HU family DNA-binding protein [Noviherbaspirillum galbum]|uniref:DNA-binding protein n=1 Tax=Noviherbaspirillum galbum TaxID=2709383 RepID=A0A6B3SNT3_9BURK|nr:HU family DNA-binding protein [Noviherbaspirillum galbum]NEX60122.1 DNA-binding protein [Noviherbaspirillum galbum]
MKKSELVEHLAKRHALAKNAAQLILEDVVNVINEGVRKNGRISITGLGTFTVTKRAARTGINPQTKAKIKIKATKVAKFKPSPALKEAAAKFKG